MLCKQHRENRIGTGLIFEETAPRQRGPVEA